MSLTTPEVAGLLNARSQGDGYIARCPAHDDNKASLSISTGDDGRVLLHCHAGCSFESVAQAAGIKPAELFPPSKKSNGKSKIVANYQYCDENGEFLFEVVRFDPKGFKQRRPDGKGGWIWKVNDVRVVPFCLPRLRSKPDDPVAVVEGEKDVINLSKINILATCNSGGAGNWTAEHAEYLRGRHVAIICDNDDAGRRHAVQVARSLMGIAASVRIVHLPNLKPKGDVSDWLAAGGTRKELVKLISETLQVTADVLAAAAAVAKQDERSKLPTVTLAEATPVFTAAEAEAMAARPVITSEGSQKDDSPPRVRNFVESVYVDPESGKEKRTFEPMPFSEIQAVVSRETGDWPRRVGSSLFVHEYGGEIHWPDKTAKLFSYFQRSTGIVEWRSGDKFVTKEEFFSGLQQAATKYLAVEEYPHYPPLTDHYYSSGTPADGDGTALEGLLDRFTPATQVDRELMKAALMTLMWGGPGGSRPVFVFTADAGRGKGKSSAASMIARLTGGSCDFSSNDDFETVKKRLLTYTGRVSFLDNVKTLKFSWAELEGLVTAPTVSGWRLYLGNGSRPNTFTWFITLNGVALSTDLAQRAVIIKVGEPINSGDWKDETERYIDTQRSAIISDLIACLKMPAVTLSRYSRWGTWEKAVLSKLAEPEDVQLVILDRQDVVDVEKEEIAIVEEFFAHQLNQFGYIATERVHIPSKIAAEWYCQATREKKTSVGAGRILSQFCDEGRTKNLQRNKCNVYGRGFIWTGDDAAPSSPISIDLASRVAEQLSQRFN